MSFVNRLLFKPATFICLFWFGILLWTGKSSYRITSYRDANGTTGGLVQPDVLEQTLPPCGEICRYEGTPVSTESHLEYNQLRKEVICENILQRMAFTNYTPIYPPPESPPEGMYDAFTQFGDSPVRMNRYVVSFDPRQESRTYAYGKKRITTLLNKIEAGKHVNSYDDGGCVPAAINKYKARFVNKTGTVIGTITPWMEALFLVAGARHVTTLEYSNTRYDHPRLSAYEPYAFAKKYLNGELGAFDFGGSYSSIEHSGLGRYGDRLNPYGDLEAMAQAWCMLKPRGVFLLGVPGSKDGPSYIKWNVHRVYGPKRLQQLTANWDTIESITCRKYIFLVLMKPAE